VDFSKGSQKDFPGGAKVVKFHFTHSKLRKQPFLLKFNRKMSNLKIQGGEPPDPFPTPMIGIGARYKNF